MSKCKATNESTAMMTTEETTQPVIALTGATFNYGDGLQGVGFSIDNPNAQRSCECGESSRHKAGAGDLTEVAVATGRDI
jgi:Fe-S cluster assembly iron-binding protein IscA